LTRLPEQQNVLLIDAGMLRKVEKLIEFCEYCNENGAEIPFDWPYRDKREAALTRSTPNSLGGVKRQIRTSTVVAIFGAVKRLTTSLVLALVS